MPDLSGSNLIPCGDPVNPALKQKSAKRQLHEPIFGVTQMVNNTKGHTSKTTAKQETEAVTPQPIKSGLPRLTTSRA